MNCNIDLYIACDANHNLNKSGPCFIMNHCIFTTSSAFQGVMHSQQKIVHSG